MHGCSCRWHFSLTLYVIYPTAPHCIYAKTIFFLHRSAYINFTPGWPACSPVCMWRFSAYVPKKKEKKRKGTCKTSIICMLWCALNTLTWNIIPFRGLGMFPKHVSVPFIFPRILFLWKKKRNLYENGSYASGLAPFQLHNRASSLDYLWMKGHFALIEGDIIFWTD